MARDKHSSQDMKIPTHSLKCALFQRKLIPALLVGFGLLQTQARAELELVVDPVAKTLTMTAGTQSVTTEAFFGLTFWKNETASGTNSRFAPNSLNELVGNGSADDPTQTAQQFFYNNGWGLIFGNGPTTYVGRGVSIEYGDPNNNGYPINGFDPRWILFLERSLCDLEETLSPIGGGFGAGDDISVVATSRPTQLWEPNGLGSLIDVCPVTDSDEDGVDDPEDNCQAVPNPGQEDADGDGFGDACDDDIDGDGVLNESDVCPGGDDTVDTDGDGVPDDCDVCANDADNDADGDGVCGDVDVCLGDDATGDSDGDGLCDDLDPCTGSSNSDADGDGICDEGDLCFGDDASGNDDGDGVCNDLDACQGDDASGDSDGDGLCDDTDACPLDAENDGDGDGRCESDDNCPAIFNPNQSDIDGDGLGDACDPDDDGDMVPDADDNCQFDANPDQDDFDEDGEGDACDTDLDGDGVVDANDACVPTPVGEVINADGCSIAQLSPCDGNWKNHGAYVRHVVHLAQDFLAAGLITEEEKGAIVSAAAQTDCGKKNR